ncbi:MAG TPA: VapC toxin family PIN domain ribonuclease [Candidatus Eisenbacteria bacterium]|nr:VapC toxin family PIN domain ribonuclease [Candidatus Eisenbacteria bacterium]
MLALDASVLAYAVNRFAPEHPRAARVVEDLANGDLPWAVPWPAVHEFLAFVTHPHAVVRPLGAGDAWGFVERLLASPALRVLGPTERHGAVLSEVLAGAPRAAELSGLETAVVLREHGVRELLSTDRAMRRFAFLSVRDPVHGEPWSPDAPPTRRYRVLRGRLPSR